MPNDTAVLLDAIASAELERGFALSAIRLLLAAVGLWTLFVAAKRSVPALRNPLAVSAAILMVMDGVRSVLILLSVDEIGARVAADRIGWAGSLVTTAMFVVGTLPHRWRGGQSLDTQAKANERAAIIASARDRQIIAAFALVVTGTILFLLL